jgi:hypothetical protein
MVVTFEIQGIANSCTMMAHAWHRCNFKDDLEPQDFIGASRSIYQMFYGTIFLCFCSYLNCFGHTIFAMILLEKQTNMSRKRMKK